MESGLCSMHMSKYGVMFRAGYLTAPTGGVSYISRCGHI